MDNCKNEYDFPSVSMKIILPAGNARAKANEAMQAALNHDFERCEELLKEANEFIKAAHRAQTEVMQSLAMRECEGDSDPVVLPMLFIHAQDTIMTIMSEVNMIEQMVKMIRMLREEIKECRK